jgi:hypothetical protein
MLRMLAAIESKLDRLKEDLMGCSGGGGAVKVAVKGGKVKATKVKTPPKVRKGK